MDINMRKLTYLITDKDESYSMVFITDRTPKWTEEQYMRHRRDCIMELVSDEETNEVKSRTYKLD
jgi:hypothetical protein